MVVWKGYYRAKERLLGHSFASTWKGVVDWVSFGGFGADFGEISMEGVVRVCGRGVIER